MEKQEGISGGGIWRVGKFQPGWREWSCCDRGEVAGGPGRAAKPRGDRIAQCVMGGARQGREGLF